MAHMLSDREIKELLGSVIVGGDTESIRPNSYVLRLGAHGEFLNTSKEFELGKKKKGLKVHPGHSVGVTALETLDFRRETVHTHFPDCDLHGILSPTTDLSREGIVAPSTHVDAGYHGTINWTITNTSSEERRFVLGERLFRLTIFRLEKGESPDKVYMGDYQSQTGYVRSRRVGAPVGMKDTEWEDAHLKGGPEDLLENLIRSGYPWHLLGQRLKVIDQQLKSVSEEYSEIHDAIGRMTTDINVIRERQGDTPETVRSVLREEANSLQNRWLVGAGAITVAALGVVLSTSSNQTIMDFLRGYGLGIGLALVAGAIGALYIISRQKK
ncbi:MAG: hypothetical protein HYV26_09720 [Candidatus Hydrogenedentes bacterium]|nr:hypothetical protein [Candidatus Hydrogenedentota bacterium]